MSPAACGRSPARMRRAELFPAPFGPSKVSTCPAAAAKLMSLKMRRPPRSQVRFCTSTRERTAMVLICHGPRERAIQPSKRSFCGHGHAPPRGPGQARLAQALIHMLAAIDGERGTGDEPGLVRNQESHAAGDLMGLTEASHSNARHDLFHHIP